MKISADQIRKSLKDGHLRKNGVLRPAPQVPTSEVVSQARLRLLNSSDVRFPEVEKLKDQLAREGYEVSPEEIAEKLLGRVLSDKLE